MSKNIIFISHGGGPMPLLGDDGHAQMEAHLQQLAHKLPKPKAILIISAHWEAPVPTVTTSVSPGLEYDYYGFPERAYQITYPCPGEPALADRVSQTLQHSGFSPAQDTERGLDHGVFVPLKIMYPQADIPVVQLSLLRSLDAADHIALGESLQTLSDDGLLVIGSGFSFHNMREFFSDDHVSFEKNQAFEAWLEDVCTHAGYSQRERLEELRQWHTAPNAEFCHPRAEHLMPLLVCAGLANRAASAYTGVPILNKSAAMIEWL
ncbi:DODA-type extradiol aromatic ring-opening family dioxygenase [Gilvimarinus chinensis]|uniref:DODA-type extradiol aromatic ring-opening family dioxygenase n=1 Tax=Gilvimarinus chinensis TaxID=396005 RepID=UPI00037DAA6C|nr:class III extradiol ring-cleavage dioxygenase [Gilvimarinus chinensis]